VQGVPLDLPAQQHYYPGQQLPYQEMNPNQPQMQFQSFQNNNYQNQEQQVYV